MSVKTYMAIGKPVVGNGAIYYFNPDTFLWVEFPVPLPVGFSAVDSNSSIYCQHIASTNNWTDVVNFRIVIGWRNAYVYYFDGSEWTRISYPSAPAWSKGIFGFSSNKVYIRTSNRLFYWDGSTVINFGTLDITGLDSVWASSANDVWAVGNYFNARVYHYDGISITNVYNNILTDTGLTAGVVGFPNCVHGLNAQNVYVGTTTQFLFKFDGSTWSRVTANLATNDIQDLWVYSGNQMWAICYDTLFGDMRISSFNGTTWSLQKVVINHPLGNDERITGHSPTDIMVTTTGGNFAAIYYNGSNYLWTDVDATKQIWRVWAFEAETVFIRTPAPYEGYRKLEQKPCIDTLPLSLSDPMIKFNDCGEAVKKIQEFLESILKAGYFKNVG